MYAFFAGGGAVKFVKDYAAAGLNKTIPLYGPGFLTDGTLEAQGDAAQGMLTTLHYADGLNTPRDNSVPPGLRQGLQDRMPTSTRCRATTPRRCSAPASNAVKGDIEEAHELAAAMEKAEIDSPRGKFTLSKAHNPVQDIYLRKVEGNENEVNGVAVKALADPARGCKM